jgi:nitrilase
MSALEHFKIAVAQLAPVFLDKKATLKKACDAIAQAGAHKARLIVFPEAYLSGYPDWVWSVPGNKKQLYDTLYNELLQNAMTIPGEELSTLCQAARKAKIYVAIGINERNVEASNASLFNTLVYITDDGVLLGKHRKLVPTGSERLIWAQGDGSTIDVFETPFGRISGLLCWENYMPLARYTLYARGTELYLAPTWDSSEIWTVSMRHIAKEGGVFVICCCMALMRDSIPDKYEFKELYKTDKIWINAGNSCVVNPKGQIIAGPICDKEEIIYADIDRTLIPAAKWILDVAGHYSRPDVFSCRLNRRPNPILITENED